MSSPVAGRNVDEWQTRRADVLAEERFKRLRDKVDELDRKVDTLSVRMAYGAGILAVISILANILGPIIVARLLGVSP